MPVFYLNILRDGQPEDRLGQAFANLEDARSEARQSAIEIVAGDVRSGRGVGLEQASRYWMRAVSF